MSMNKIIPLIITGFVIISGFGAIAITETNNEKKLFEIESIYFSELTINQNKGDIMLEIQQQNSQIYLPGIPILPAYTKTFMFPIGTKINNVKVDFTETEEYHLDGEIICAPSPVSNINGNTLEAESFEVNADNILYPEEKFSYTVGAGINDNDHVIYVTVRCYPVQFNNIEDKIIYSKNVEIKIKYEMPEQTISFPDVYDMIIIAPPKFMDNLEPLVEHKNNIGLKTILIDEVNDISGETYFPVQGRDCAEQMKYFIKSAIEEWGIDYVLLVGGRAGGVMEEQWYVPVRYSHVDDGAESSFLADLYFADIYKVEDNETVFEDWDPDGDGIFSEWKTFRKEDIDGYPDIHLGRLPCINEKDVDIMVNKIINYENTAYGSDWFKKIICVGGDSAPGDPYNEGEEENKKAIEYLPDFEPIALWTSDETLTGQEVVIDTITEGGGFLFFDGHGNPSTWSTHPPGDSSTWITGLNLQDMRKLKNNDMLPICVVGACHNGQFNVSLLNILKGIINEGLGYFGTNPTGSFWFVEWVPKCWAWWLTSKNNGGSIATMAFAGLDWFATGDYDEDGIPDCTQYYSGFCNVNFFKNYGQNDITILGQTYTQTITDYINQHDIMSYNLHLKTVQELTLMGDPSMQIGGIQ